MSIEDLALAMAVVLWKSGSAYTRGEEPQNGLVEPTDVEERHT